MKVLSKAANVILMLFSVFVCLFFVEIFLRAFYPQILELKINYEWRADDEILPYVPRPSYSGRMVLKNQFDVGMNINSSGFRGKENISHEKVQGEFRAAFIGDSFTFGWGVEDEEAYPFLFGKALKKLNPAGKVTIINAAVYGYDIVQYTEVFKRVLKYSPDVIFLGFCLENDLNITPLKGSAGEVKEGVRIEKKDLAFHVREFINRLHLVTMVRDRLYITFPSIRNLMLASGINNKRDIFLEEYTDALKNSCNEAEKILVKMSREAKEKGIDFAVVLIPLREQIYCREELNKFPGYNVDRPNEVLSDMLERNGIACIDLLPEMVKESNISGKRLYFDIDPHWTRRGHSVASKILEKEYLRVSEIR